MKLGTENRTTTIVAAVLMVIAVFLLVRMWVGGGPPAAAANTTAAQPIAPPPAPVRARRTRGSRGVARSAPVVNTLDPRLRLDLLKLSEDTEYSGSGRNIFIAQAEIPKPVENPVKEASKTPPPPQVYTPPPPPPINLKFVGFARETGEPTKVFLAQGDNIFVAKEGEIVNRRYKVTRINANSVEIEDLLSNNRQTIPLSAG